jgi:hypothetical protein
VPLILAVSPFAVRSDIIAGVWRDDDGLESVRLYRISVRQ